MIRCVPCASLALLAATCARPGSAEQPTPKPLRVQAEPAQAMHAGGAAWVAGTLLAAQRAVVSTRIAARVRTVRVEEGSRVRRGEPLIRLDDDEVVAQLRSAETALSAARTHERRIATLVRRGAATESQPEGAARCSTGRRRRNG